MKLNHILLIDDEITNNFVHKIIFKKNGLAEQVDAVESVEDAFKFLSMATPDLIILDLNMPAYSGFDFLELYPKYLIDERKPKFVILSASHNPEDHEKAFSYEEVIGFLNKPLKLEEIVAVIDEKYEQ